MHVPAVLCIMQLPDFFSLIRGSLDGFLP